MVYGILFFFIFSRRIFNIPPRFPLCIYLPFFFLCMYFSFHHRGGDHARAPPRLGLTCHARIEQTITTCTYQPTCTGIAILDGETAVTWFSCAPMNTFVLLHRDSDEWQRVIYRTCSVLKLVGAIDAGHQAME